MNPAELSSAIPLREAIVAIGEVRAAHPDLCWSGFEPTAPAGAFEEYRAAMSSPGAIVEFQHSVGFLRAMPGPWSRMNRRYDAYGWKGMAERWAGGYVSEGMFLAAALHLGFRVEREVGGRSAFLNLSPAVLTMAVRPRLLAARPRSAVVIPFPSGRSPRGGRPHG